jgi:RNA polymerase sigma-70 factor (ECF subfamily)
MSRPLFRPRLATRDGSPVGTGDAERDQAGAFRTLMLPHLDAAYNLARYLTRDAALAEDVVQDAFLRAHKAFAQYRGVSAKAWLFAIVRNCCWSALEVQRGIGRVTVSESALSDEEARAVSEYHDESGTPESQLLRFREAEALRGMIMELPEPFRETLVLREMDDLSYKEIAAVTGVAMGTVMSRLARARMMLGELLMPGSGANTDAVAKREAI